MFSHDVVTALKTPPRVLEHRLSARG